MYQTERWHDKTFTYSIPLKEEGQYVLVLKFSEVYFNEVNEKVFDVALGKEIILKDIDIFARVGKAQAHDEYISFELQNNRVLVNRKEITGAYDVSSKLLKLRFIKGLKDNPKINAILLIKGDINGNISILNIRHWFCWTKEKTRRRK